jgi:hypothetical protein
VKQEGNGTLAQVRTIPYSVTELDQMIIEHWADEVEKQTGFMHYYSRLIELKSQKKFKSLLDKMKNEPVWGWKHLVLFQNIIQA